MTLLYLLGAPLLLLGIPGQKAGYRFVPGSGRLELLIEKTGLMRGKQHHFVFERYHGALLFDPKQPENSQIQFRIESASAVCKDTWLSAKDLKKVQDYALNDMLGAGRYPELKFVSTGARASGPNQYEVQGTLTIRDATRPVVVSVTLKPETEKLLFEGSSRVRLTDFGLKPPTALLGAIGTKDEMTFTFSLAAAPAS